MVPILVGLKLVKPLNLHGDALWSHWNVVHDLKKGDRNYRCSAKFNSQLILVYLPFICLFLLFRQGKFTVQLFFLFFFSFFSVCAKSIHLNRIPLDREFHMMMIDFPTQISQLLQAVWFESDSKCEHHWQTMAVLCPRNFSNVTAPLVQHHYLSQKKFIGLCSGAW